MYYKYVSKYDGKLYSMMRGELAPELVVEYLPQQWVTGDYPLFIYKDLDMPRGKLLGDEELWECSATNARELDRYLRLYVALVPTSKEQVARFWEGDDEYAVYGVPPMYSRTRIADAVMLTRKVA